MFRPPGNLFLRLIWRSFRPSGPWCFAVSEPPARTSLWSCFEGMGAGSSSQHWMDWIGFDFQQESRIRDSRIRQISSRISEGTFRPPGNLFLRLIWRSFRPSGPWCFAVSEPPARTSLWSCFEGMGAGSSSQRWIWRSLVRTAAFLCSSSSSQSKVDWIGLDF